MRRTGPLVVSTLMLLLATGGAAGASPAPLSSDAVANSSASPSTAGPAGSASPVPMTPVGVLLWPAPPNPIDLTIAAGLTPERAESMAYHVHAASFDFSLP